MAWTAPRTWTDGELVTASIMNTHVRDNELSIGPHLIVRKTSDETVTSSAVLQNDDALLMALGTNETWLFEFDILFTGGTTGDFKTALAFPASTNISATSYGRDSSLTTIIQEDATGTSPTTGRAWEPISTTVPTFLMIKGVVSTAGTSGNLTLQWAQNTSDATGTVVKANSTLWAVKLA